MTLLTNLPSSNIFILDKLYDILNPNILSTALEELKQRPEYQTKDD